MKIETTLWKRSHRSYAKTKPHLVLLNHDLSERKYKVIWEFNARARKWSE